LLSIDLDNLCQKHIKINRIPKKKNNGFMNTKFIYDSVVLFIAITSGAPGVCMPFMNNI
jgi:hypothetical protein